MLSRVSSFSGPLSNLFRKAISIESYSFATQNLILYLDAGQTASYPGTGTTWSDLSVQDNDSTLSNVSYSSGYLTFNGINSAGSLSSSKYNVAYSGKTIFVSAYLAADMSNSTFRAFLGSSAGSRNFNFYLNRESGSYRLHFSSGGVGGFSSAIAISPGSWFTAAITQTAGGLVTYYYNGAAAGTDTNSFSQYLAGSTEHVGRADNYWDGRLGVVAVYKTALSASEVLGNHRSTLTSDGFAYANFASTSGLTLVSTDGVVANALYVTNTTGGTGNVYRSAAIRFDRSFSFQWVFECSGGTGADGFCLQWTTTNDSNGSAGGGVGRLSAAINAISFLTFVNNSVTWHKNNVSQGAQAQAISFRQNVYYWFDYDHALSTGNVYYSTTATKPASAQHSYAGFSFDSASYYIGIGAATGGSTDNHILKSMSLAFF